MSSPLLPSAVSDRSAVRFSEGTNFNSNRSLADSEDVDEADMDVSASLASMRSSMSSSSNTPQGLRDSMTSLDHERAKGGRGSFSTQAFMPERSHGDIAKRYDIDKREHAAGGYGKVFMAIDRASKKQVAIKRVVKQIMSRNSEAFYREVKIMKDLDHPNICKLLETYEHNKFLYFVMECCHGGEVFERIIDEGTISEAHVAQCMKQVASALRYAHNKGIAHRDLKPENVCFCEKDDWMVKVIDWGLGFYFGQNRMSSAVGSLSYAAPEVLQAKPGTQYGSACDVWSMGVLAYVMLSGKPPFWGSPKEQMKMMRQGTYPFKGQPWDSISQQGRDFIQQLLRAQPDQRLSIEEVTLHPWFRLSNKDLLTTAPNAAEVLRNMQQFKNNSTFYQFCSASVARQLDHSSLKHVHRIFAEMDTNGDGTLDLQEVKAGFERLFGVDSDEARQVEEMFEKLDLDGSGNIDYTEFCAAGIGDHLSSQEDTLWAAFKAFDADDNGTISKDEIAKVLMDASVQSAWSQAVCDDVAKEILEKFDVDGSGEICFDEWLEMMQARKVERTKSGDLREPQRQTSMESRSEAVAELDHLLAEMERAGHDGDMARVRSLLKEVNQARTRSSTMEDGCRLEQVGKGPAAPVKHKAGILARLSRICAAICT